MIKDTTLSDKAYQALKEKIINLKSGTYLSARQFASEIGMSYTPVREAFLRLQREGAIKQVPNVGFFVETVDLADLYQTYEVRECIEPFVLKKAFNRFTPEHIATMRKLVEKQAKALSSGKIMEYIRLDIELHEIMFRIYNNKQLLELHRRIREQHMFCSNKIANTFNEEALNEHRLLIDTIEAGNLENALNILNAHIENAKQRMKEGYISVIE
ncbi:MAG TPA: GntR family transcriptional regulator [Spirochaetales bacterium]|nr:GntR family transcriptional regulator [Spirochaetales bacterium]HQK34763.1 GntR family transcriptional regulator [Spirochaetales bacterium]